MPLKAPPTPALTRASSLPRRLSFAADTDAHFADAMNSVHQYLRGHLSPEHLATLGVNDSRARSYFDDIQQFLARHRSSQHQPTRTKQEPQNQPRRDSNTLLLDDLDAFLDELDPVLFGSGDAQHTVAAPSASRLQRPGSYIHEMQARAFAAKRSRSALAME